MGKWDKLNQEFDQVLDSLTKEDWIKWDNSKKSNRELRYKDLIAKSIEYQTNGFKNSEVAFACNIFIDSVPSYRCDIDIPPKYNLDCKKKNPESNGVLFFYVTS